jgi:hypothetical protein
VDRSALLRFEDRSALVLLSVVVDLGILYSDWVGNLLDKVLCKSDSWRSTVAVGLRGGQLQTLDWLGWHSLLCNDTGRGKECVLRRKGLSDRSSADWERSANRASGKRKGLAGLLMGGSRIRVGSSSARWVLGQVQGLARLLVLYSTTTAREVWLSGAGTAAAVGHDDRGHRGNKPGTFVVRAFDLRR